MNNDELGGALRDTAHYAVDPVFIESLRKGLLRQFKEKTMPTEKEVTNALNVYLSQLQNMTPLEPSGKDMSEAEHDAWSVKDREIEQIVRRAELEALRLVPASIYQLVKEIWHAGSALYSPPASTPTTPYQHTLHFHTRSLAEHARDTIATLQLEFQNLTAETRSVHFNTAGELDTGTILLIVEKTRPLSSAFNEEPDKEDEEETTDFVKELYDKADYDAMHKDNDEQGNPLGDEE
jgi:hypothetical protein